MSIEIYSASNSEISRLVFSSPSVAQSEDGSVRIRPARGDGNGIDRYSFSIRGKGDIYLQARNTFDKDDNCAIHIGLLTLDGNIGFLTNRHENERQHIIDLFSEYLFRSFVLQFSDETNAQEQLSERGRTRVHLTEEF